MEHQCPSVCFVILQCAGDKWVTLILNVIRSWHGYCTFQKVINEWPAMCNREDKLEEKYTGILQYGNEFKLKTVFLSRLERSM